MGDTFHCVRAMNVLNDSYFSAEQMRKILLNVHNSLKNNGLFIAGSNQDPGSPVSGAVFSKNDSNFDLVWMTAEAPQVLKHINLFNDRSDRHQ
jgi:chemotaxis methyl-accepting protein methylase